MSRFRHKGSGGEAECPSAGPPLPENLGALLDQKADEHPDDVAWYFIGREQSVTFGELRDYVNRAANALRKLGVSHGTHVAVMSSNSLAYCGGWLALGKLGAVAVPVNTRYTPRELFYVLDDAEVDFLIIEDEYRPVFESMETIPARIPPHHVIAAGATDEPDALSWDRLVARESTELESIDEVALDDLINIQYTSGTTGFPKGCMLTHRFWMLSSRVVLEEMGLPLRRALYNQNFFYMDGPFLTVLFLFAGATFYFVSRPSASRFVEWIKKYRIEYCFFFEPIYKVPETQHDADNDLKLLQTFGFNRSHHADLERRFGAPARESYGMTECGVALVMPRDAKHMVGSGSCGLPVPYRELMIVDEEDNPVPRGEIGELLVRGPGMMLGYYRKPEANAETFLGDWLRTGDLFRQDEAGYFYIVGRTKDMVRRNAENIACREVEEVLRELDAVKEAAVVPVPDDRVGEEVKAYIQLQAGLSPDGLPPASIIEHCQERLATFKVPRYIAYRSDFPMTDSSRVEKTKVVAERRDLTLDSYDRVDQVWR